MYTNLYTYILNEVSGIQNKIPYHQTKANTHESVKPIAFFHCDKLINAGKLQIDHETFKLSVDQS